MVEGLEKRYFIKGVVMVEGLERKERLSSKRR